VLDVPGGSTRPPPGEAAPGEPLTCIALVFDCVSVQAS
jgi:hypothetical protein